MFVVLGGLMLFLGLTFLMLRRRNEMLQTFLTPEEKNLEEEFFRIHMPQQDATPPKDAAIESEKSETEQNDE